MKDRLLVGLDIGTSAIRVAIGQVSFTPDKRPHLNIMGVAESPSKGISKGSITALEDAVSAITQALEQAERLVGLPLTEAVVGIGGTQVTSQDARGVIGVSRPDGDIRHEDIERVLDAARSFVNPANQEIIHVIPRSFSIDGQGGIKDPTGMQGIRLEVDAQIVTGLASHVRNLTKAVFRTGLDITQMVFAPIAAAETVTSSRERELGVCVLNVGASTTGLCVYENGELLRATTLPIGADHITSDIAIVLRIAIEAAERIKRVHGTAATELLPKKTEEMNLLDFGAEHDEFVTLRYISEIIEARVEELFEKVSAELKKIDRDGLLPAGIVLTGGGAKLTGMVEVAKRILRLPAALGKNSIETTSTDLTDDSSVSTAVGLVLWEYFNEQKDQHLSGPHLKLPHFQKGKDLFKKVGNPLSKLIRSLLP